MGKISNEVLDNVLEVYRPEYRYLTEANFDYPIAKGLFRIPMCVYINPPVPSSHFTLTELSFCYNQLSYAFFANSFQEGLIPEVGEIPLKEVKGHQLRNSFIVGMNNIKFKKPIDPKEFEGKITLEKIIPKRDDLIFFKTSYDFGNGKATGNIDLAFLKD